MSDPELTVSPEEKPKSTLLRNITKLILLIIIVPIWFYVLAMSGGIYFFVELMTSEKEISAGTLVFFIFFYGIWISIPFLAIRSNIKARRRKLEKTSA